MVNGLEILARTDIRSKEEEEEEDEGEDEPNFNETIVYTKQKPGQTRNL